MDWRLKAIRAAFATGSAVAPRAAARAAERLFYRPRRFAPPPRERAWTDGAERFFVQTRQGVLAGWSWGDAARAFPWEDRAPQETVLLVHGWEGRGAQLGAFAAPLVALGYRVVAYDGPAHGASPGAETDLPTWAACVAEAAAALAPVRAVVAHSMGAAATTIALAHGAPIERAVLIAPPCSVKEVTRKFKDGVGLDDAAYQAFLRRFELRFGADVYARFSGDALAGSIAAPALIVHDADDADVELAEGERLADAWPDARLLVTRGLGHTRVLRDPRVVAEVVRFVTGARSLRAAA